MKKKQILAVILSATMLMSTSMSMVSFARETTNVSVSQQETLEKQQISPEKEQDNDSTDASEQKDANDQQNDQEVAVEEQKDGSESDVVAQADGSESDVVAQADEQTQQTVYLSVLTGSDNQDGTLLSPVKTLKKALEKVSENGTIVITGEKDDYWNNNAVVITEDTVINKGVTILRGPNCGLEMFSVQSGRLKMQRLIHNTKQVLLKDKAL